MNEKYNTEVMPQEPEELELDLRDMLAVLLLKWKTVLACFLVLAVLCCGFALVKNSRTAEKDQVTDEEIEEARSKLAENKAIDAERLFFQYLAYQELQRDLTGYYREFVSTSKNLTEEDVVQMRRKYYVTSGIENLGNLMATFTLGEEEYNTLRAIAPDEELGARIYNRVNISSWDSSRITVSNMPGTDKAPIQYLFTLSVYGTSEAQCEDMMQIVDRAFLNQLDVLKPMDQGITVSFAGDDFNHNMLNYVTELRKQNIDKITSTDKELTDLATKVSKLDSDEQKYYNLMKKQYEESQIKAEEEISWKKWTAIGGVLGLFLGAVVVFWPYLFDGRVKTAHELESSLSSMVLSCVTVKGKKKLFGKWAASLTGADDVDPAVKADMIAADLSVLMEKNGKKALYLLRAEEDENAVALAQQVKVRLQEKNREADITVGNPLSAAEDLEQLGAAELGVVFVELKKTKRNLLRQWRQICSRYRLPLAGSVTVQQCW